MYKKRTKRGDNLESHNFQYSPRSPHLQLLSPKSQQEHERQKELLQQRQQQQSQQQQQQESPKSSSSWKQKSPSTLERKVTAVLRTPSPLLGWKRTDDKKLESQMRSSSVDRRHLMNSPDQREQTSPEDLLIQSRSMRVKIRTRTVGNHDPVASPFARSNGNVKRPQSVDLVFPISPVHVNKNQQHNDKGGSSTKRNNNNHGNSSISNNNSSNSSSKYMTTSVTKNNDETPVKVAGKDRRDLELEEKERFLFGGIVEEVTPFKRDATGDNAMESSDTTPNEKEDNMHTPVRIPMLNISGSSEKDSTVARSRPSVTINVDNNDEYYPEPSASPEISDSNREQDISYRYALTTMNSPSQNRNVFKNRVAPKKLDIHKLNPMPKNSPVTTGSWDHEHHTGLYVRSPLSARSLLPNRLNRSPPKTFPRSLSCSSIRRSTEGLSGDEDSAHLTPQNLFSLSEESMNPVLLDDAEQEGAVNEMRISLEQPDPEKMKQLLLSSRAKTSIFVSPFSLSNGGTKPLRYTDLPVKNYQDALHRSKLKAILKNYLLAVREQPSYQRRLIIYQRVSDIADSFAEDSKVIVRTSDLLIILIDKLVNSNMRTPFYYEESKNLLLLLSKLCRNDVQNKECFRKNRGIFQLVHMLKNAPNIFLVDGIYENLLSTFLSSDHVAQKEFREYGGVSELISILEKTNNPSFRATIMDILFRSIICIGSESRQLTIQELGQRRLNIEEFTIVGGINLFLRLFAELGHSGEQYGLKLATLVKYSSLVQNTIAQLDALPIYLSYLLQNLSPPILEAISTICYKHEALQHAFRERNGFQILEKILTLSSTPLSAKIATLRTIGALCRDNLHNMEHIHLTGLTDVISRLVSDRRYSIELAKIIVVICNGHTTNQITFAACIEYFIQTIQQIDMEEYRTMELFSEAIRDMSEAVIVLCTDNEENILLARQYLNMDDLIRCMKLLVPGSREHSCVNQLAKLA